MPIPGQFTTIRVRWPETTNGTNIAHNDLGQPIMKEMELPLTAKPFIEEENRHLPIHLRKKIDILNYMVAPAPELLVKGVGKEMLKEAEKTAVTTTEDPELVALRKEVAALREKESLRQQKADLLGEDEGENDGEGEKAEVVKKKSGRPPAKKLENA